MKMVRNEKVAISCGCMLEERFKWYACTRYLVLESGGWEIGVQRFL